MALHVENLAGLVVSLDSCFRRNDGGAGMAAGLGI